MLNYNKKKTIQFFIKDKITKRNTIKERNLTTFENFKVKLKKKKTI